MRALMPALVALGLFAGGMTSAAVGEARGQLVSTAALGEPRGPPSLPRLRQSADRGEACERAASGYLLAQGIGMPAEPGAGRAALTDAGARGCRRANYLLARLDEAQPSAPHRERVFAALQAGAAAGDGHALNHLGTLAEIDGDPARARALYAQAQAAGNRAAVQNLLRLRRLSELGPEREPFDLLERRARAGDAQAQYRVARRIHRGDGASIDFVAAWHWYKESARQGFKPALEMMALLLAAPSAKEGRISARWWASLALLDVPSDPLLRQRGLRQPIVDEDLFYGMR